jgi:hypothetical protein
MRGATQAQQGMALQITLICGEKKTTNWQHPGVKIISGSRWGSNNNNNNNNNNLFLVVNFVFKKKKYQWR